MTTPHENLIRERQPIAPFTTWQIGGPARYFAEPTTPADLACVLAFARTRGLPVFALGGASNVLVSDRGFPGLVVRYLDDTEALEVDPDGHTARLIAGSRALLSRLARRYARIGWSGLEWAEGIPGTLGGAIVGNAGAYGGEMSDVVEEVKVLRLLEDADSTATEIPAHRIETWSKEACEFAYRTSRFKELSAFEAFVIDGSLRLPAADPGTLLTRIREIGDQRKARSPVGKSCGSVFQNPAGDFAGRLIEEAGLRGAEYGRAQISPEHGNYIVNLGGATSADILALIALARREVETRTGTRLQTEVQLIGFEERDFSGAERATR